MNRGQSPSTKSTCDLEPIPSWPTTQRRHLANGLEVLVSELPHVHTAAAGLFARVGSRHESAEQSGLSHLVEHVLFRGCERHPDVRSLNEAIEEVAVELGGSTGREFCAYEAALDPRNVEALIELLGEMFHAPTFAGIELERAIILEELRDEIDERGRDLDVDNLAKAAMFPRDPLGQKIGGDERRLRRFDEQACRAWFSDHYGAENMVFAVAGPLAAADVFRWADANLGRLPRGERRSTGRARVREDLPALEYLSQPGPQSDVQLTWPLPSARHDEFPALVAAYRLLEDGASSRLRRHLVDERALAYRVGASLETYEDVSLLTIEASTSHEKVRDVVEAALHVIQGMATETVPAAEWSRWRRRATFDVASGLDHPAYLCSSLGLSALLPGQDSPADRLQRALAVSREELRSAVSTHLSGRRLQLSVIGELEPIHRAGLRRIIHRARA